MNTHPEYSSKINYFAFALLLMSAALQVFMVFRFEANWDEFFLLDWLYQFQRGELAQPIATIYLRIFGWLPLISINEVDQIVAARVVMLGCALISCIMIYLIARRFFDPLPAMAAVLAFVSFTAVFRHVTSFRVDTMSLPFLLAAVYLVTGDKRTVFRSAVAGVLIGIAGLITIKSIFYAIMVGFILMIKWAASGFEKHIFLLASLVPAFALVTFGILYFLHASTLPNTASADEFVSTVVVFSLYEKGFFPEWQTFVPLAKSNPVFFFLLFAGLFLLIAELINGDQKEGSRNLVLLALTLPLVTLLFYRHAHAYYYVHLLASASVIIAVFFNYLLQKKLTMAAAGILAVLGFAIAKVFLFSAGQTNTYQRQVVALVHELFPEPVGYIDRTAMISSFPKHGLFMSRWGMLDYYAAKMPIMAEIIENEKPLFVLANIDSLDIDQMGQKDVERPLFPEDQKALKSSYIRHWGPVYVPGKHFRDNNQGSLHTFTTAIEGQYTIESRSEISLNGNVFKPGSVIELDKNSHSIDLMDNKSVTLRWGDNLFLPQYDAPDQELFRGF